MTDIQKNNTIFFEDDGRVNYTGVISDAYRFICEKQLMKTELWDRFVNQFREMSDTANGGWKGEFWGKMMRGASLVYSYLKDDALYNVLKDTVCNLLDCEDEFGRISTYTVEKEFTKWDMWCRKYVILGMEYFLDICTDDELKKKIIGSISRQVDYMIEKIGNVDGKTPITSTSDFWRGLNSSSVLESVVRLYALTDNKKYLDFAEYIIDEGCLQIANIFDLASEDGLSPYQYPITKAYEMTSCFEGLLEYYRITGIEKHKETVIKFANKLLETDFTVIGCSGCTEELFDHSTVRQANTTNADFSQETCVTVTIMKFFARVYAITGDPKYLDAYETSFYNSYLGAFNIEDSIDERLKINNPECKFEPLPFDSYSPLTVGFRGKSIGGFQIMSDGTYYGCCACISSAGMGLFHKFALMKNQSEVAVNFYAPGERSFTTPGGKVFKMVTDTCYPACSSVKMTIETDLEEEFSLLLRNPAWSLNTSVLVNGESENATEGYIALRRNWKNGDVIELNLDMRTRAVFAPHYTSQVLMNQVEWDYGYVVPTYDEQDPKAKYHIALQRGPLMLAIDDRLGYDAEKAFDICVGTDGYVQTTETRDKAPFKCIVGLDVPLSDGKILRVIDYASAGKLYNEGNKMAVWIRTNTARSFN